MSFTQRAKDADFECRIKHLENELIYKQNLEKLRLERLQFEASFPTSPSSHDRRINSPSLDLITSNIQLCPRLFYTVSECYINTKR